MTNTTAKSRAVRLRVGDVIEDRYGNPAVVILLGRGGWRTTTVMQTVGSDRFRLSAPGGTFRRVEGEPAEWALRVAREGWMKVPPHVRAESVRQVKMNAVAFVKGDDK